MQRWILDLYHRSPGPLRTAAAGIYGYYLRSWRYGADTESLVAEAIGREQWPASQWTDWRADQLPAVLQRAATCVPYYRNLRRRIAGAANAPAWDRLEEWPLLEKEPLRAHARSFVVENNERLFAKQTSGTTGTPLTVWMGGADVRRYYALFEARVRRWNGVTRHDRWAIFGGRMIVPAQRTRPPFWVWNAGLRQLYMSTHHLAPAHVRAYAGALHRYGVVYAIGYPALLYWLSLTAREQGVELPRLKVVISNAEPLYDFQRAMIGRAFNCPVRDMYGLTEGVCAASECEAGSLHLWPEVGVTEILNDDSSESLPLGRTGRLVGTSLLNAEMPLIRYLVGDRAAVLDTPAARCKCGRTLPTMTRLQGRTTDALLAPDGRRAYWMHSVFYGLPIHEGQIVQEEISRIRVKVIPAEGFGQGSTQDIIGRVWDRLGRDVQVVVEKVGEIPRTGAGKFRPVVSLVSGMRAESPEFR